MALLGLDSTQRKEEELEQRLCVAERRLHGSSSTASSRAVNPAQPPPPIPLRLRPVVRQLVELEEPMALGGAPAGSRQVTRQTTYTSYTSMELWDLAKRCKQHMGQVASEMEMRQMMFALQFSSSDDKVVTAQMKDLILANGPAGDVEVCRKGVCAAKTQGRCTWGKAYLPGHIRPTLTERPANWDPQHTQWHREKCAAWWFYPMALFLPGAGTIIVELQVEALVQHMSAALNVTRKAIEELLDETTQM
ncbi:hypothetical protein Cadr_000001781 [Camelus dromedarius]|uniref:Uncharacterized protein n=1 Tax=Camelus dromedarius TaxID=9838 RepID=A0A5N4EH76_CAMDR|nr:hypothetical protein Cadr_000001781 [Camelus dromedarius]